MITDTKELRTKLREVVGNIYSEGYHCGFTKEESFEEAVDAILKAIDEAGFEVVPK